MMLAIEWLSNADDAKATKFHILLDYSTNPKDNLLEPTMDVWQGHSLWIYNDAIFSDEDWLK